MIGILLTLLAVLLVICLAFCSSEHNRSARDSASQFPFLYKSTRKRS